MSAQPNSPENTLPQSTPVTIHAQYTKDLSFENPNPVAAFATENAVQPNISVSVQARVENLGGRNFESVLDIRIDATRDAKPLFLVELVYCGIVSLAETVSEEEAGALLMVDCPRLLFPFARNILADTTRDGGFPPIMLAPVDFAALYEQQRNQPASEPEKVGRSRDK